MKTLRLFMTLLVFVLAFTNCNKDEEYNYPNTEAIEGDVLATRIVDNMMYGNAPENSKLMVIPDNFKLSGNVNFIGPLASELSYLKFERLTFDPILNHFNFDVEMRLMNENKDGVTIFGALRMNMEGELSGKFNIAKCHGNLIGSSGVININGVESESPRNLNFTLSGHVSTADEIAVL